jgi:CIC family chloride channel protein
VSTEARHKRLAAATGATSPFGGQWARLKSGIAQAAERGRLRLSAAEVSLLLAGLGAGSGLLVGLVVLMFRLLIEGAQGLFLSGQESYQTLPPLVRLLLPMAGAGLIGLYLRFIARDSSATGVTHVMSRVSYHQGYLPWRNAVTQLIGATLAIVSGHPVGREGPGIHLGAATSSLLG